MSAAGGGNGEAPVTARVRCFVGAFLSAGSARELESAVRACLGPALAGDRAMRQVPTANYHVTLKFLGEIDAPAIERALGAVADLHGCPVTAQAVVLTGFPRLRAARLAAAVLAPHVQLEAWWSALQQSLGAEERSFRPHVTVLRLRRPRTLVPRRFAEPVSLDLQVPQLYRSDQTEHGVVYRPVQRAEPDRGR